jgi:hypothetical protein
MLSGVAERRAYAGRMPTLPSLKIRGSGAAIRRPASTTVFASPEGRLGDATLRMARRSGQAVVLEDLLAIRLVDCHGRKRNLLFDRLAFDDLQRLADSFRTGRGV